MAHGLLRLHTLHDRAVASDDLEIDEINTFSFKNMTDMIAVQCQRHRRMSSKLMSLCLLTRKEDTSKKPTNRLIVKYFFTAQTLQELFTF